MAAGTGKIHRKVFFVEKAHGGDETPGIVFEAAGVPAIGAPQRLVFAVEIGDEFGSIVAVVGDTLFMSGEFEELAFRFDGLVGLVKKLDADAVASAVVAPDDVVGSGQVRVGHRLIGETEKPCLDVTTPLVESNGRTTVAALDQGQLALGIEGGRSRLVPGFIVGDLVAGISGRIVHRLAGFIQRREADQAASLIVVGALAISLVRSRHRTASAIEIATLDLESAGVVLKFDEFG